jgi:hypothetical protein
MPRICSRLAVPPRTVCELRGHEGAPSAGSMRLPGTVGARIRAQAAPRLAQESFSCHPHGLPRKPSQFRWTTRISPALCLAVSVNTLSCHYRYQLGTRAPRASRVRTAADRLQLRCARAARRPTKVWRFVCRGRAGSRREGGNTSGDLVARWRLRRGARQDETTRYSTSITSDEVNALTAPTAVLGSPGCARRCGWSGDEPAVCLARFRSIRPLIRDPIYRSRRGFGVHSPSSQ